MLAIHTIENETLSNIICLSTPLTPRFLIEPQVDNKEKTVNVRVPQPVRKCIKKKVQIPTVTCEDNKEQRCFELVTLEQTEQEIEKCHTIVGPQECQKVTLNLPSQVCVDEKSGYGRY